VPILPITHAEDGQARLRSELSIVAVVVFVGDVDSDAHPRVNAALEVMLAEGQIADVELAALQNACASDGKVLEAGGAFRRCRLAAVKRCDEAATELLNFSEGVRLTALIGHDDPCALANSDVIGFEVPVGIRMALGGFVEQGGKVGLCSQRDILAEVRTDASFLGVWIGRPIESSGVAFIKSNDLDGARRDGDLSCSGLLRERLGGTGEQQCARKYSELQDSNSHSSLFLSQFQVWLGNGRRVRMQSVGCLEASAVPSEFADSGKRNQIESK